MCVETAQHEEKVQTERKKRDMEVRHAGAEPDMFPSGGEVIFFRQLCNSLAATIYIIDQN